MRLEEEWEDTVAEKEEKKMKKNGTYYNTKYSKD